MEVGTGGVARDGGDGEERIVRFEFGVLVFEIGFGSEAHLVLFGFSDSVETVAVSG